MAMHGKKYKKAKELAPKSLLNARDAFGKVKELAFAKFDESVDAHVNVGIDPTKGDQNIRGSVVLPHGLGKVVRVIVFAKGDYADKAEKAGADVVGVDELIEKIEGGWLDFDYAVATPDLMGAVGKLAKLLGPRGLLPNKKVGTVTFDVASVVKELKEGRVFFKNDKSGLVHFTLGKVSFDADKLVDNFNAFFKALQAAKPSTSKGKYIKKLTVTSTMGPGIPVNPEDVN
jgi:large subunit ribosomal protein L1